MASTDDLKAQATGTTDFYALLGLEPSATEPKALDRAWRRTALKYHPDKVGAADTAARDKFHLANIGYEILRDPTLRQLYDRTRAARLQREQHLSQLAAGRRAAREELEARERGAKRSADTAFGAGSAGAASERADEEHLEREIRRLAEDGRRRREALAEKLRQQEREAEAATAAAAAEPPRAETPPATDRREQQEQQQERAPASEMDRTVKARFARSGAGADLDAPSVQALFMAAFGPVDIAFDRKDKKGRSRASLGGAPDTPRKQVFGTVVVVFQSLLGAHAAVERWSERQAAAAANVAGADPRWAAFDDVSWAAGAEPAAVQSWGMASTATGPATPSKPSAAQPRVRGEQTAASPHTPAAADMDALRGVKKSFGSFSPAEGAKTAAAAGGIDSPFVGAGNGSPSLEELTLMRLRHAEKRRAAAEQLRREEEAAGHGDGEA